MKAFNSDRFVQVSHLLGMIHQECCSDVPISILTKDGRQTYLTLFRGFESDCSNSGLVWSTRTVRKIINNLPSPKFETEDLDKLGQELISRLSEEMESMMFLFIEPRKQELFVNKNLFGAEVAIAFPSAIVDIEEAGKCFALDRFTACVFHLMRIMELGLRVMGGTLNLKIPNPTWDALLKKCESELAKPLAERSPEWALDNPFYASATAMLRTVKEAWRNPTMHIERVYSQEQAEDIFNTVKAFMRQLAVKLTENTK